MSGDTVRSASKEQRAAELVEFLCDPAVAAVVPPCGGELAIDLLDQLDWDATGRGGADVAGRLERHLGLDGAADHCGSAGPRPTAGTSSTPRWPPPDGLLHWTDLVAATGEVTQRSPGLTREGWDDWRAAGHGGDVTRPADRLGGARRWRRGRLRTAHRRLPRGARTAGRDAVRRRAGVRPRARRRGAAGLPRGLRVRRLRRVPAVPRAAVRGLVRPRERRPGRPHAGPRTSPI